MSAAFELNQQIIGFFRQFRLTRSAMARTVSVRIAGFRIDMQNFVAKCALSLVLALLAQTSFAQGSAPDAMLRAVSADVIDSITRDREFPDVDPAKVADLVQSRILPLFDFERMTRLAVARNWQLATPAQQDRITAEFRTLLSRTYSAALLRYRGESVVFKDLRAAPRSSEVTVKSEVKQTGNKRTTLDYEMAYTAQGWKIHNVKVADVSLISNYRDVFAEQVRDGGVDGLIRYLADANRGGSRFDKIKASVWEKSRVLYAIMQNVFRRGMH